MFSFWVDLIKFDLDLAMMSNNGMLLMSISGDEHWGGGVLYLKVDLVHCGSRFNFYFCVKVPCFSLGELGCIICFCFLGEVVCFSLGKLGCSKPYVGKGSLRVIGLWW